ncbi:MAG: PP2C family protein-serine/threonine phosphatase [Verrucomicrobia bacterium]|nr:PP2C family protein-serine/threonine phosphatase [Verrucomicrobiota bacterium]
MVHRFQTRLAVSVSLVIALTVAGMTLLILVFASRSIVGQDRAKGILLHRLLQSSIENLIEIPGGFRSRPPRPPESPESSGAATNENSNGVFPRPEDPPEEDGSQMRIRRFGMGRRGELRVELPGQRGFPSRSDLLVQGIANCFVVDTDIEQILVVEGDGRIVATASVNGAAPGPPNEEIVTECREFLRDEKAPFRIRTTGPHVAVINALKDPGGEKPRALYVQFRKASALDLLGYRLLYAILIGFGMIVVGILMSIKLSRRLSQPVNSLASNVREFGEGNLSHRIQLKTDDEFQALGEAFNQMAGSVQAYTQRLECETKRRESLESELRIAADLQRSLLPENPPKTKDLDMVGWSQSAAQVGGDFFDYLEFGENQIGVMIGDATGKGLPAALLTNECWSMLTAFAQGASSPAELLFKTNNALCKRLGDSGQFVTLFLMLIDVSQRSLRYSVAGHNPPFLIGQNPSREQLLTSRKGFPLGLFRNCEFENIDVPLTAQDTIFLYSDGLTDASSPVNGRYGTERLRLTLNSSFGNTLPSLIDSVRHDLEAHTGGAEIRDDVTMVGVRFTGST